MNDNLYSFNPNPNPTFSTVQGLCMLIEQIEKKNIIVIICTIENKLSNFLSPFLL